jgi:predicted flap endonuclease-1-like 5' DNA nuclease
VEGIGPKIEGLLKAGGINTWSELAAADTVRIQEVLAAAGARFKLAVPRTWSQQAGLAAAGNWAALKSLQEELNAGK